ncbi:MAG TPA: gliding motility protein RemB [Pelobium sp.]|nr:gliding motility protein RemB [Pelobium sp.]
MKKLYGLLLLILLVSSAQAQTPNQYQPYSFDFYQKLNDKVYDSGTSFHSSIKPYFLDDSILSAAVDSFKNIGADTLRRSWVRRKLLTEHLVDIKKEDYTFYADYLPDLLIGRDHQAGNIWLNTRGYQFGGTIGEKFSFYTSGFENQAVFPAYIADFVDDNQVVPGQVGGKFGTDVKDWAYSTASLSYTANKYLNVTLAYDKNFIGDGYRSMLLSDVSANYSFLRLRASLGSVQYQTVFAYMLDPGAPKLTNDRRLGDRGKWGAFHYLDWNVNKRFSLGFFQAVTWADAEPEGKRGFDFNYVHPFVFLRPIESANSTSPDKMRLGINTKYEVLKNTTVYGQFMIDEFTAKEFFAKNGYWANKWALQLGFRGSNLFGISRLNYLGEFNTARPYTYAHFDRVSNYSNYNQPLAHPFGANFREFVGLLNYSVKRFDFSGQLMYAYYGLDPAGENFGKNIFLSYNTRSLDYNSKVGNGIATDLYFAKGKVSYLINPNYNLRLEASATSRMEENLMNNNRTLFMTFGLRSSFRNFYDDF